MKTKIFAFFIIIFINQIFPQGFIKNYFLNTESNSTSSVQNETPASNSISDILIVGDTIWLGTSRGLSRSTDKGNTWKNFYGSPDFGNESITALKYYQGFIFVATAHSVQKDNQSLPEGSGIKFSSNNGDTWKSISQTLDNPGDSTEVYGINNGINLPKVRALPVTTTIQNLIYDIAFTKNTIWIATFAGGLRKNSIDSLLIDQSTKWKRVILPSDKLSSITPNDTIKFALQPVAGKFGTDNNLNHRVFSVISFNDSSLFVGSANGVNRSTDNGISWIKSNHQNNTTNPISGNFIVALDYNQSSNTVWAASWKAEDQNEFYGVSYSSDFGSNWQTTLQGEKAHNFGTYSSYMIAATDVGPYLGTIFNKSVSKWFLPGSIIDNSTLLSLKTSQFYSAAYLGSESIWLGSNDGLIKNGFVSDTWRNSWKLFFATQPLNNKEDCYAYPNPFSPKNEQVKIKYSTGGNTSTVTIRVFDFGMNYVRTIIQAATRGNPIHSVNTGSLNGVIDFWDGKDDNGNVVPNGVYFYRIDIDSKEPLFGKIMVLQ
jgi:hypothetical protein